MAIYPSLVVLVHEFNTRPSEKHEKMDPLAFTEESKNTLELMS